MISLSGRMLDSVIAFRNPSDDQPSPICNFVIKAAVAEVAFIAIIPIAIIDAALGNLVKLCLPLVLPSNVLQSRAVQLISEWGTSSAYAIPLALVNALENLFKERMTFATLKEFENCCRDGNAAIYDDDAVTEETDPSTPSNFVLNPRLSSTESDESDATTEILEPTTVGSNPRFSSPEESDEDDVGSRVIVPPSSSRSSARLGVSSAGERGPRFLVPSSSGQSRSTTVKPSTKPATSEPATTKRTSSTNIAAAVRGCKVGSEGMRFSIILQQLYENLPNPTPEDRELLTDTILGIFGCQRRSGSGSSATGSSSGELTEEQRQNISTRMELLIHNRGEDHDKYGTRSTPEWKDRIVCMLWSIGNYLIGESTNTNSTNTLVIKLALLEAFGNCNNRMTTEVEGCFFSYAAPDSLHLYAQALTEIERLIIDLQNFRRHLLDRLISKYCTDSHNASSFNYFRRELNAQCGLPSSVSALDTGYQSSARIEQRNAIIQAFKKEYTPAAICTFFEEILYGAPDNFRYQREMFQVWLINRNGGTPNYDDFADEDCDLYRIRLIVEYLIEKRILSR